MTNITFSKTIVLHKLLELGPLEPMDARIICGWPVQVFDEVLVAGLLDGSIKWICKNNQHPTLLAAA